MLGEKVVEKNSVNKKLNKRLRTAPSSGWAASKPKAFL